MAAKLLCSSVLSFFHLDAGLVFSMPTVPDKSGTTCYQTPKRCYVGN